MPSENAIFLRYLYDKADEFNKYINSNESKAFYETICTWKNGLILKVLKVLMVILIIEINILTCLLFIAMKTSLYVMIGYVYHIICYIMICLYSLFTSVTSGILPITSIYYSLTCSVIFVCLFIVKKFNKIRLFCDNLFIDWKKGDYYLAVLFGPILAAVIGGLLGDFLYFIIN